MAIRWLVGGYVHHMYNICTISVHHPYNIRTPCVHDPYTMPTGYALACSTLSPLGFLRRGLRGLEEFRLSVTYCSCSTFADSPSHGLSYVPLAPTVSLRWHPGGAPARLPCSALNLLRLRHLRVRCPPKSPLCPSSGLQSGSPPKAAPSQLTPHPFYRPNSF